MAEIIPAILPRDYEDLKNKVAFMRGLVGVVQVDICDGVFVSPLTWPFHTKASKGQISEYDANLDEHFKKILNEEEGMPFWEEMDFELDLMVADAIENFNIYSKLGPKRIIFHLEAVGELEEFGNFLEGIDSYLRDMMEIGVAINPKTPIAQIFPLSPFINFVQFMGNDKIGYQGVSFDEKVFEKIKVLREKYPFLPIAVDIGVNKETALKLIHSGATKLVIGSAIFNADNVLSALEDFQNL